MSQRFTLRSQLLFLVGGPLLLLLLVQSAVSYRIGLHTADQVFDRWLLDSAYSLAQEVVLERDSLRFAADRTAIEVFEWDELDDVYYRVSRIDGLVIAGLAELSPVATVEALREGPLLADVQLRGTRVRAASLLLPREGEPRAVVTVAETLNKRSAMTADLLNEVLLSKVILFLAVLVVIGMAVDRGLAPLVLLNRELAQRTVRDLSPIYVGFAPDEVRGLVDSVNRLLARLEVAIGSREQFIGNIAHQIRTPLAGIKLQAQLAQRAQDPQQVHTALERISTAADQMAHVNSQLLKLARAEAASGRGLRTEPVDLTMLARECVDELSEMAREHNVRLELQAPADSMSVTAELTLLREMLLNLLQNAIEYGREGGRVCVSLRPAARGPVLAVEDDGPGIGREHWPRIFERFFRPTGASGSGCGLGLAIVREIALAHRATVELVEPEQGSGTRFVVRFGVESA